MLSVNKNTQDQSFNGDGKGEKGNKSKTRKTPKEGSKKQRLLST